jgi:hypothetical protein
MTEFKFPETLQKHRPLLLACEAIGWLHMMGKAKREFLEGHGGMSNSYKYEKWHENETPPFDWCSHFQWVKENFSKKAWPNSIQDFIEQHTGNNQGLLALLQAGHGMASGIEKNFHKETSKYLGQDIKHMWLSSAFGYPVRNLLSDPPELLTDTGWKELLEKVEKLLNGLKYLGNSQPPHNVDSWHQWRDKAVGPKGWLRKDFSSTLAETRLPNNDVTLFDQSYVAAALFKSAVAGAIMEGKKFPWSSDKLKQKTRWRLLTVGMGSDHYESRSVKIGDWTGARLAIDEFFDKVCKLVEVDWAVGSLLYRDGEVCVFSFPGEREEEDVTKKVLKIADWKTCLEEQLDSYAQEAKFEMPPYCNISEVSRSLVLTMTKEIYKARKTLLVPIHRPWKIDTQEKSQSHVCPAAVRPQGSPGHGHRRPAQRVRPGNR